MKFKSSICAVITSLLCVSQAFSMLIVSTQLSRFSCSSVALCMQKRDSGFAAGLAVGMLAGGFCDNSDEQKIKRNIYDIYKDVVVVGKLSCSGAYYGTDNCRPAGCTRCVYTTAKNVEMQQSAYDKRKAYLEMIDSDKQNDRIAHLLAIRDNYDALRRFTREAIQNVLVVITSEGNGDQELYRQTFGMITHKKRCLFNRANIILDDAVESSKEEKATADEVKQIQDIISSMREKYKDEERYVKEHVPSPYTTLCDTSSSEYDQIISHYIDAEKGEPKNPRE